MQAAGDNRGDLRARLEKRAANDRRRKADHKSRIGYEDMMTNRVVNATGAALLALSGAAEAAYRWNLPTPVTRVAGEIYDLHLVMMGIILVIFVGVFGVMFYSIYDHRKSVGHKAENFHENITVEIIWAIIPFLILIAVAWPATKSILNLKDTASPDIRSEEHT